ncbi:hypothetical protein P692DRAFT_20826913 [Suillus brevipes Sb2]|nr:hypothetical protein P692DRAFT_20826913 [Suillus brevipes Sb2]
MYGNECTNLGKSSTPRRITPRTPNKRISGRIRSWRPIQAKQKLEATNEFLEGMTIIMMPKYQMS